MIQFIKSDIWREQTWLSKLFFGESFDAQDLIFKCLPQVKHVVSRSIMMADEDRNRLLSMFFDPFNGKKKKKLQNKHESKGAKAAELSSRTWHRFA